jgi:cysteine desulfurase
MMPIYLDNNATTKIAPPVREVVLEAMDAYGNPFSMHSFGRAARAYITKSRDTIASFLSATPQEIIFTASGTEALNLAIRGFFGFFPSGHIITSNVEHAASYNTVKALEEAKVHVTWLEVGKKGSPTSDQVLEAIRSDTRLIVLMAANNETGAKCDIAKVAAIAKERKIPFVVDAVQLLGKEPFSIPEGVSCMCFSGHKLHAPKGVGFVFVRKGVRLIPYMTGGNQERGLRGGTENCAAIAGLGMAIELIQSDLARAAKEMARLRDLFEARLIELGGVERNGEGERIPNTSNLFFQGVEGEILLMQLDLEGVAASHGSACATGALEPSRVLLNMGYSRERASSSLRFSLSRFTREDEIIRGADIVTKCVRKLRGNLKS